MAGKVHRHEHGEGSGFLGVAAKSAEANVAAILHEALKRIQDIVQRKLDSGKGNALAGRGLVDFERTLKAYYDSIGVKLGRSFRDSLQGAMKDAYEAAKEDLKTDGRRNAILGEPDTKTINRYMQGTFTEIAMRTNKMSADHIKHLREVGAEVFRKASMTGMTRKEATAELMEKARQIPNFKFVANNEVVWKDETYFRMLARTELMNTGRAVYDDTCAANGYDVVRLDYSGECCEKCAKYEGTVFSLTGATEGIPTKQDLIDAGVFHPNCTHSYTALTDFELAEMGLGVRNPATKDEAIGDTKPTEEKLERTEEEEKFNKFFNEAKESIEAQTRGFVQSLQEPYRQEAKREIEEFAKVVAEDRMRGLEYNLKIEFSGTAEAYYSPWSRIITIGGYGTDPWYHGVETFMHESGHLIHDWFFKDKTPLVDEITECGRSDFKNFTMLHVEKFSFGKEAWHSCGKWLSRIFYGNEDYKSDMGRKNTVASVADTIESITNGKWGFGHGAAYHRRKFKAGGSSRYTEAIADIRAIMLGDCEEAKDFVKKCFPEMVRFSRKIGTIPEEDKK